LKFNRGSAADRRGYEKKLKLGGGELGEGGGTKTLRHQWSVGLTYRRYRKGGRGMQRIKLKSNKHEQFPRTEENDTMKGDIS